MPSVTRERALRLAREFVKTQALPDEYTLDLESPAVSRFEDKYQVRYNKLFKEPTKESPPYRLVIVEPNGSVHWGMP